MLCYEMAKPCIQYDTAFPSLDPTLPNDVPSPSPSSTPTFPSSDFITPPSSPHHFGTELPSPSPTKKRPRSPSTSTPTSSPSKRAYAPTPTQPKPAPPPEVILDTTTFPSCLSCALSATYAPLRHFAEFFLDVSQSPHGLDPERVEDEVGVGEVGFAGFGRGRERRESGVGEGVEREIGVRSFWSEEGPGVGASPVKKQRVG